MFLALVRKTNQIFLKKNEYLIENCKHLVLWFSPMFQGMLALEGELTPILVQMVKSANTNGLLDAESNTSKYQLV